MKTQDAQMDAACFAQPHRIESAYLGALIRAGFLLANVPFTRVLSSEPDFWLARLS